VFVPGVYEVTLDPGGDGLGGFFWRSAAGIDAIGDVAPEPSAELDLFFNVAATPRRAGVDAGLPQLIGAVEQNDMDVADPVAGGEFVQTLRDERTEQHRGQPGLGDAVRDRQPPTVAECRCAFHEEVGVEGDTSALQSAGKGRENSGLASSGRASDDEQRSKHNIVPGVSTPGTDSLPVVGLHGGQLVAGLAIVHPDSMLHGTSHLYRVFFVGAGKWRRTFGGSKVWPVSGLVREVTGR
jgi:hypothetical protein